jgi:tetratricopeptide (TPR) repeat protein
VIIASISFSSCSSPCVGIYIKRPAEIDINKYKKIAVGDIVNQNNIISPQSIEFYENLLIMLSQNRFLEEYDKSKIRDGLIEHRLWKEQVVIYETEAGKMAEVFGPSAFITGRFQDNDYSENITVSEPKTDTQDSTKKYIEIQREGIYTLSVIIKIIASETSQILMARNFRTQQKATTDARFNYPKEKNNKPPEINKQELFRTCIQDILSQIEPVITPHTIYKEVCFKLDKDELPENENTIKMMSNNWQGGTEIFRQTTNKPNISPAARAKAFYNYGMALLYSGNFKEAIDQFNVAVRLNPTEPDYSKAIEEANFEIKNAEKLNEQVK